MKKIPNLFLSLVLLCSLLLLTLPGGCQVSQEEEVIVPEGGTLNLFGIDPHTLDPAISGDATSHQYVIQIFSGLVCLDENLEPVPDIAEEWKVSNDGKTYTFYLRRDVKFHDGRMVKAEDFEYSWQRACNPALGSQTAAAYLGDIVGVKEVLSGQSTEISGVRVINDYTIEVTIDAPKSYFLSKMTYPTAFVVDRSNVESSSRWWYNPNGTGPFILKEWDVSNQLVLERNGDYYGELANLDSVVFSLWGGVPMNMYETGEIDITGVPVSYIDRVTDKLGPFHDQLIVEPELSFYYIGLNINSPPFDDINIRHAFSRAIDKEKLASLVFRDMIQPAYGILPPGIPGFNEELSGLTYDVDEAMRLIEESSYGDVSNLPTITITTAGWGGVISGELEAIIHQWQQNLGVEVQVRQLEPERFLYYLEEEMDDMFDWGWIADYPHPQNFLEILFHSDSEHNNGGYSNPEVDALIEKANVEMDYELSLMLYQQAEQKMVDDAACIPLWFGKSYILIKPHVKGYELSPMGTAMLNKVWIDQD